MAPREPTKAEEKLATLLIGVDTLCGGDALHPSGAHHAVADAWFSGDLPPLIYFDPFAKAARDSAQGKTRGQNVLEDAETVNGFVRGYRLRELPLAIKEAAGGESPPVRRLTDALDVMLKTVVAQVNGRGVPDFEERYHAATAGVVENVAVVDPSEARERLQEALVRVGYEVTPSRNLRETMLVWQAAEGRVPAAEVVSQARAMIADLLDVMRNNLFSRLDFRGTGYQPDLSDVAFSGHTFAMIKDVDFTGSSIYRGGENEGRPLLRGLFEYNSDHPITRQELRHLCAHEVIGHYINSAVQDILWRAGKLEFLATMGTMCSPGVVFQEGWAQAMPELLYGSRENAAWAHGHHLLVALALEDLQDIGKHNGAIMHQRDGRSLDEVRRHVAEDCVQTDPIVKKLSGGWATHPVNGPMYGPAYFVGGTIVREAIQRRGSLAVARAGYHLTGLVDIAGFEERMEKV